MRDSHSNNCVNEKHNRFTDSLDFGGHPSGGVGFPYKSTAIAGCCVSESTIHDCGGTCEGKMEGHATSSPSWPVSQCGRLSRVVCPHIQS